MNRLFFISDMTTMTFRQDLISRLPARINVGNSGMIKISTTLPRNLTDGNYLGMSIFGIILQRLASSWEK